MRILFVFFFIFIYAWCFFSYGVFFLFFGFLVFALMLTIPTTCHVFFIFTMSIVAHIFFKLCICGCVCVCVGVCFIRKTFTYTYIHSIPLIFVVCSYYNICLNLLCFHVDLISFFLFFIMFRVFTYFHIHMVCMYVVSYVLIALINSFKMVFIFSLRDYF